MNNKNVIIAALREREQRLELLLKTNPDYVALAEVRAVIKDINHTQDNNTPAPLDSSFEMNGYNPAVSAIKKAIYVVAKAGHGLTTKEICDNVIMIEPNLIRTKLISGMSAVLGDYAKNKKRYFKRIKNKAGEWVYSLLE